MPPINTVINLSMAGTYILEDDGIIGNATSQLRRPDGGVVTIVHPLNLLKFSASEPGVTLVINMTDSLDSAKLTVGSLTDSTLSPDRILVNQLASDTTVTLVSNGQIADPVANEAFPDLYAARLIMKAGTGIGESGFPFETQVGVLEAMTGTGGIRVKNIGDLVVGGLTDSVAGLDVATSGELFVTTTGSMRLSDATGAQVVHGGNAAGGVALWAGNGVSSDVTGPAIVAPVGLVTVLGGNGSIALGANNDISAGSGIYLAARNVLLSGDADVFSDAFGIGFSNYLYVNGDSAIELSGDASLTAGGTGFTSISLLTNPGGHVFLNSAGANAVHSPSGAIEIVTDTLEIGPTSGITSGVGVSAYVASLNRRITLGLAVEPQNALELDGVELSRIFAPRLDIGNFSSGAVRIEGVVDLANVGHLGIHSLGDIFINRTVTVLGSVTLETTGTVTQLAGADVNTGTYTVFVDRYNQDGVGAAPQFLGGRSLFSPFVLHGGEDGDTLVGNGAPDLLIGNGGDDILAAGGGNDALDGGSGADRLNGGTGADAMEGGAGDDTFYIDTNDDQVIEVAGNGTDTIFTTVSYFLGEASAIERLFANPAGGTAAINLGGNSLANNIQGNAAANILLGVAGDDVLLGFGGNDNLNGGAGNDTLVGGTGDDVYVVDSASDLVIENDGEGSDAIFSHVSYNLREIEKVERLAAGDQADTDPLNFGGNSQVNFLFGNAGANVLLGNGGDDVLLGRGGDDILNGGTGNDNLNGGLGNDIYFIDSVSDVIVEVAGEGTNDRVFTSATYILRETEHVEQLLSADRFATTRMNLTGNSRANIIQGNDGDNILDGKGGNDTLLGFESADTFVFSTALNPTDNVDTVVGFSGALDKILLGGAAGQPFAALPAGTLAASAFVIGSDATTAAHRIVYNNTTGGLFYDADGAGGVAKVQFAILSTGPALTNADFIVADPLAYAASQPRLAGSAAMEPVFSGHQDDATALLPGAFADGDADLMAALAAHAPLGGGLAETLSAHFF